MSYYTLPKDVLQYVLTKLKDKFVLKESGKGLSSNDYTATEKDKLSGIEAGANKYIHPTYTSKASGLYKITVNSLGHVSAASTVTKDDITGLGIPAQDTTYGLATTSTNGLMSSGDRILLNSLTTTEVASW